MARVLFCAFSNVTWTKELFHDSHAEAFINELVKAGNQVFVIRTNTFVRNAQTLKLRPYLSDSFLEEEIQKFNPELIITYNNSLPGAKTIQLTDCPIIVYPADVPAFWCDKEYIQRNLDRYYFFDVTEAVKEKIFDLFPGVDKSHLIPFGYVTGVYNTHQIQDIDISFVGSVGNYTSKPEEYFTYLGKRDDLSDEEKNACKQRFFRELDRFSNDGLGKFEFDFPYMDCNDDITTQIILLQTCYKRMHTLNSLVDLNLQIFGYPESWSRVLPYNYQIFKNFTYETSVTLADSINTYNRSKISLNPPHGNAIEGFSWRVCDILASNAALCSVKKGDLIRIMKPYIDLPTFESPAEARELCCKLLADDVWRTEIVEASNRMIDENCRHITRFRQIEDYIGGMKLVGERTGTLKNVVFPEELSTSLLNRIRNKYGKKIVSKLPSDIRYALINR